MNDEIGSGLNAAWPPGDDHGMLVAAFGGHERDAREVEGGEQVRVAELGGEAHAQQVEVGNGAVPVDGELRHPVLAHQGLEVGPDGVRAFRERVGAFVDHLVQDHDALVGEPDLVGVGVHQRPANHRIVVAPRLDLRVELAADVLNRLAHQREQGFQAREDGRP